MKYLFSWIIILVLLFSSCNNSQIENSISDSKYIDTLFNFVPTSDSKFCNKDSVMATDCGYGTLYLTKNGNAIYNCYCLGSDTTIYCIGTYCLSDSGITCIYTQDYLYADCTECAADDTIFEAAQPTKGFLRKEVHEKMQLIKANCINFEYYVPPTAEQKEKTLEELKQAKRIGYTLAPFRGYVFSKATLDQSKAFRSFIRTIPALADL